MESGYWYTHCWDTSTYSFAVVFLATVWLISWLLDAKTGLIWGFLYTNCRLSSIVYQFNKILCVHYDLTLLIRPWQSSTISFRTMQLINIYFMLPFWIWLILVFKYLKSVHFMRKRSLSINGGVNFILFIFILLLLMWLKQRYQALIGRR